LLRRVPASDGIGERLLLQPAFIDLANSIPDSYP
jgi:hypothetical protein